MQRSSVAKADELRRAVESFKSERGLSASELAAECGVSPSEFNRFMDGKGHTGTESAVYGPCETLMEKRFRRSPGEKTKKKKLPKPPVESFRTSPSVEEEKFLLAQSDEDSNDQVKAFDGSMDSLVFDEGAIGSVVRGVVNLLNGNNGGKDKDA